MPLATSRAASKSATRITDEGWFAEIALPFSILRFEAKEVHTFGINFSRNIQRTKEDLLWRSWSRNDAWRVDKYGELNDLLDARAQTGPPLPRED